MSETSRHPVSVLLIKWRAGDQDALQALIPLVYQELRLIAKHHLRHERPDHTLQSTALVHEAYLRMVKQGPAEIENRAHFIGVASRLMRQILVDHARKRKSGKRSAKNLTLLVEESVAAPSRRQEVDLILLDDALNSLAEMNQRHAQIVELRFFGGLSIEDTSRVLEMSPTTVKRDWATARAWLFAELRPGGGLKS